MSISHGSTPKRHGLLSMTRLASCSVAAYPKGFHLAALAASMVQNTGCFFNTVIKQRRRHRRLPPDLPSRFAGHSTCCACLFPWAAFLLPARLRAHPCRSISRFPIRSARLGQPRPGPSRAPPNRSPLSAWATVLADPDQSPLGEAPPQQHRRRTWSTWTAILYVGVLQLAEASAEHKMLGFCIRCRWSAQPTASSPSPC